MGKNNSIKYYSAVAVLTGQIVGVGMFGLPFLVSRAGLLPFFAWLFVLLAVQYLVHLIYANIIVVTVRYHRLPGYAGIYLGNWGKKIIFTAKTFGNYGVLLAYIIISGSFLHQLLCPVFGGSEFMYASILFALEAGIVYFGIKMIARTELVMTSLLLLVTLLLSWKGLEHLRFDNFISADWRLLALPYGAMFLALDGAGALPIVAKVLDKDAVLIKKTIRSSLLISALVLVLFVFNIVGISGAGTSADALAGVVLIINNGVITFALIFGILSMATSFFGSAESIREALWWDYGFNRKLAWALAVFVPYTVYALGVNDLTGVISFVGAVAGGICSIALIAIFLKLKKLENKLLIFDQIPPNWLIGVLVLMFVLGVAYQLLSL